MNPSPHSRGLAAGTTSVPAAESFKRLAWLCGALLVACAAPPPPTPDAGEPPDAGELDGGTPDAGEPPDAGELDGGAPDAGTPRLDWNDPAQRFGLGPFEVETCGRHVVCATHPAHGWGALGLEAYDARTYDRFADVWDGGRPGFEALRDVIADSRDLVLRDRQAGCPAGSVVTLLPTREVTVGGQPGLAWGFEVFSEAGHVREKMRQYATLRGETLWFFTIGALDRRLGCLEVIGEFTPEAFALLEPSLDGLAAGMTLPDAGR